MNKTRGADGSAVCQECCGITQYLITGTSGYIGREIAVQLREQGCSVRGLVRRKYHEIPMPEGMELVIGDILEPDSLDALFEGIDPQSTVLIHSAAIISLRKYNSRCERVNLAGTENVIAACKKHGIKRLVYFSSVDALSQNADGSPISEPDCFFPGNLSIAYGRSKAAAAQCVLDAAAKGLDCTLLLPSAVIGPGDYRKGFITQMFSLYLKSNVRVSVEGGYEFVDVRDVAWATIEASRRGGFGDCYIISNRYTDMTSVLDALAECTGRKPPRFTLPIWVLYPLSFLISASYYIIGKEPPMTIEAVNLMRTHPEYSHEKAVLELGFSPRPLQQTIADTAEFIIAQNNK